MINQQTSESNASSPDITKTNVIKIQQTTHWKTNWCGPYIPNNLMEIIFFYSLSITALRILICASLQESRQYKFLTEMIFCFLNLSLCEGGIVAPSQESERAHLHQKSRRSCVAVLFSIPGYITEIYRRRSIHKKVSSICWVQRARGKPSGVVWTPDLAGQGTLSSSFFWPSLASSYRS